MRTLRLLLVPTLLALAAGSPAPINDRSAAEPYRPERSQAALAKEQRFNGAAPVVGGVQVNERRSLDLRGPTSPAAADALNAGTSAVTAARAVTTASERVAAAPTRSGFPWLTVLLLVAGMVALLAGLKTWADRAVPVPKGIR